MIRSVSCNGMNIEYRGKDIKDIINQVKNEFPQIKNWRLIPYTEIPGMRLHGDCANPLLYIDIHSV